MIRTRVFSALLIGILAFLVGCDKTPTGRWQLALAPSDYMKRIGAESFSQMKQSKPVERDPGINAFVSCVARSIIAALPDQKTDWEVVVFRERSPNAFALPGGKIGIHTGILNVAKSDAQLATIIGHEVGHVLAEHANERLTQQMGVNVVLLIVGFATEGGLEGRVLREVLGLGAEYGLLLPFSRAHEEEADLLGLDLMARAGFDPRASLEFWKNMARGGGNQPPELLSTHPSHDSRFETLNQNMAEALATRESVLQRQSAPKCSGA